MLQLTFLRLTIIPVVGGGASKKENDTPNQQEAILKEWHPFPKDGWMIWWSFDVLWMFVV